MDKVKKYKNIIQSVFDEILAYIPNDAHIELLPIIDEKNGHYMIYSDGWQKSHRDYACFFHVHLKSNGKIHLRHDGTNLEIGRELVEKVLVVYSIILVKLKTRTFCYSYQQKFSFEIPLSF